MSGRDEILVKVKASLAASTSHGHQPGSPSDGWLDWAVPRLILDLGLEREVSDLNRDCVRYVTKWELKEAGS